MLKIKPTLAVVLITLLVFFLSKNSLTGGFKIQIALLSLLSLITTVFILNKKGVRLASSTLFIYLLLITILSIVAATGWFFSPFFFALYLLAIALSFVFAVQSSLAFVITLVILFSFNIGEVDLTYDFLSILSLLTTILLSFYLRKEYLKHQEEEKEILVLKRKNENLKSSVDQVLNNKINELATNLRQPINDIRLIGIDLTQRDLVKKRERIANSAKEALRIIDEFEEETTGQKLLSSP